VALNREQVTRRGRPICWPAPDATCLEGGCVWCEHEPVRSWREIADYAATAGQLPNRGGGHQDSRAAFAYGADRLGAPPGYRRRT
jgi:hypothetical protein